MAPIPRLRDYKGPALLSYGFRPFFLFGSLYAGLAILAWLPMFYGELELSTAFAPRDWHIHEMLYGYLPAVITGFLLTAVPNWTGRMPLQGRPLLVLVLAWAAGRVAVTTSAWIGWEAAAVIDNAFLLLVAAAMGREIIKGRNWRNLKVLIALGVLLAGNILFHVEAHVLGAAEYGIRFGIAATMMLIMLIGGRIIPSFTRNWLARENPGRLPAPFGRFDVVSMIAAGVALLAWIAAPGLERDRGRPDRRGRAPGRAARPLGGGAHLARPARPDPARRLRLRAARLRPGGAGRLGPAACRARASMPGRAAPWAS